MVGYLRRWILVLRRLTPPDLVPRGLPSPDPVPAPWPAASAAGLHVRMPPPPVPAAGLTYCRTELTLQSTEEFRKVVFGGQVTEEVDDPRKMLRAR
ncbi:hypothetical protein PVAP13_8KG252005 [Panicum virgatum]|uniref:Uncharacterized protein n=1 Tax=Panicum virgatum TaxID=38727 RepID=A0A8T0PTY0_PANVG|nr:hypothetical protein PVAP13_8KG252005 [Panicum virgatum]